jgi:hypothetical protein
MVRSTETSATSESVPEEQTTGCYVYGVVPAEIEVDAETRGVGDPPTQVRSLQHGRIAALVSDVSLDRPLGTPQDLLAHEELLDAAAAEVPVLPLRFGAVITDDDAVVEEFLRPNHDEFVAALEELEGRAQYVVKGRYIEDAVFMEILEENPEAARLRDEIRDLPEDATRNERIQLGEMINEAITAKREADTAELIEQVDQLSVLSVVRQPSHEQDAVHVALLIDTSRQAELEQVMEELGRRWVDRIKLRLLGPLAAYDFVMTRQGDEGWD